MEAQRVKREEDRIKRLEDAEVSLHTQMTVVSTSPDSKNKWHSQDSIRDLPYFLITVMGGNFFFLLSYLLPTFLKFVLD